MSFLVTGIWTRTLKDKTGLHQTSLTRLLKLMEGKKQIKVVKSVKVSFLPSLSHFLDWLSDYHLPS
jgi:hypothetical protein